jgi:ribosomal protein S18 acetylase RimI-like enzyme
MIDRVIIRELIDADCVVISRAFAAQGWRKPASQYQSYLHESRQGKRAVLIAEYDGEFAGYVTIVWDSDYLPFKETGVPEIADFNVLIKYRRKGVGTALMDEAERRIAQRSAVAGIGVGLTADYGAAQILYAKRGYAPDGRGVHSGGRQLSYGDQVSIDDDLVLYLTKVVR